MKTFVTRLCRKLMHSCNILKMNGPTGPAGVVDPNSGSTYDSVATAFHNMALQFVQASTKAWPEDILLPIAKTRIVDMGPREALTGFDKIFGRYVERLSRRDLSALFEAGKEPLIAAINVEQKFNAANLSTQEVVWTYVCHLCKFHAVAKLYQHIPAPVLGAVNVAASGLKARLDAGELDVKNINPFELGQQVMSQFDPNELDRMMRDMMKNPDAVNAVMAQMNGFLSASGPDLSSIANMSGIDFNSMLKFLNPK